MSAVAALQAGLHAALAVALPAVPVHDHVPADAAYPYIVFGAATTRDFGGVAARLEEHTLFLFVWSKATSRIEAVDAAETVRVTLDEAALTVSGHAVVNRTVEEIEITRNVALGVYRAEIRLRAVTSPIA